MGRLRRIGVTACSLVLLVAVVSPAFAEAIGEVRDGFGSVSYSGNDGSIDWSGDWLETPLAGEPDFGEIRVVSSESCDARCLSIGPGNVTGRGVHRQVDLASAVSATLTFDLNVDFDEPGGKLFVAASDDGWSWIPLADYSMNDEMTAGSMERVDLSDWAGRSVRIGFFGSGALDGRFLVDNVAVRLSTNERPEFVTPLISRTDREGESIHLIPEVSASGETTLRFTASGLPTGLAVEPATGLIAGTIAYSASSDVPYATTLTVTDGDGVSSSDSFTWNVADSNRPPSLGAIADQVVDEMTPMRVPLAAADPDLPDDELGYHLAAGPAGATIDEDGVVEWTPSEEDGPGSFTFTVRVSDVVGASAEQSFEVHVGEVNSAPKLDPIPDVAVRPGDEVSLAVEWVDEDLPANAVTFEASGLPEGVSIEPVTGLILGTISDDAVPSSGTVVVMVTDDGTPAGSDVATFSWQIGTGNLPPILHPISDQAMASDGSVVFTAVATDGDGDDVSFWLAAGIDPVPNGAAIDPNTGQFTWAPEEAQHARSYRVNVGVSDSGSPRLSDTQLVTITIPEYNEPPSVDPVSDQSGAEGDEISLQIDASDTNPGDTLTFTASGLPPGLTIDPGTGAILGSIEFTASNGSPYSVAVTGTDDGIPQRTHTIEFEWIVANTNRAPIVESLEIVTLVGAPTAIMLPVVDPDGDPLVFTIVNAPVLGELIGAAPEFEYSSVGGPADHFSYVVTDGEFEVEGSVSIELRLSNDPPTASLDEYEVAVDEVLSVSAPGVLGNDTDPDRDTLVAEVTAPPEHGELQLESDGGLTYQPDSGYVGADKFTYVAVDELGERSSATVVLTVLGGDPVAIVVADPVDNGRRSEVILAGTPGFASEAELGGGFTQTVSALFRSMMSLLSGVRYPLILLMAFLILAMSVGRVSLVPGSSRSQEEGWLAAFDDETGIGTLITDVDGSEVFVHRDALGGNSDPETGTRLEFIAATIRGRRIALKAWPAV